MKTVGRKLFPTDSGHFLIVRDSKAIKLGSYKHLIEKLSPHN